MSRPLRHANFASPHHPQQQTINSTFQELLSAFRSGSSKPDTRVGRNEDRRSGSSSIGGPLRSKQVGGPFEVEIPPSHVFTEASRRDSTLLDNDDGGQKLLAHRDKRSGGPTVVQVSGGGSCCSTHSAVDHEIFDPFAHLLVSPYVLDNGRRPPYQYAMLIGMAILSANNRRLTLAQIYHWISDNFPYYSMAKSGWQNSIRHNLSVNKNFVKIERSRHEPGKGHFWGIKHGQEHLFVPGESHRRHRAPATDMAAGNLQSIHGSTDCSSPEGGVSTASNTEQAGKAPDLRNNMRQDCPDHTTQSSHGNVAPTTLDLEENRQLGAFSHAPLPASTISRPSRKHGASPLTWGARYHRMGTQSGLEADGVVNNECRCGLPNKTPIAHVDPAQLTLQAGFKRLRFGKHRAEAEIARIRDSNAKGRTKYRANTDLPVSSSIPPSRRIDSTMDDPSTPCGFEKPSGNLPSMSPGSMLRMHRENVRALLGLVAWSYVSNGRSQRLAFPGHFSREPAGLASLYFYRPRHISSGDALRISTCQNTQRLIRDEYYSFPVFSSSSFRYQWAKDNRTRAWIHQKYRGRHMQPTCPSLRLTPAVQP
ncbi:hypothetical protein Q7P37_009854 [Cladosporium fusiforme]